MKEFFDSFEKRMDEKLDMKIAHLETRLMLKLGVIQIATVGAIFTFMNLVKLV